MARRTVQTDSRAIYTQCSSHLTSTSKRVSEFHDLVFILCLNHYENAFGTSTLLKLGKYSIFLTLITKVIFMEDSERHIFKQVIPVQVRILYSRRSCSLLPQLAEDRKIAAIKTYLMG